jgi:rhodanese-related sulfurtransferase
MSQATSVGAVDLVLARARSRIGRIAPEELEGFAGLVVDIRPAAQRELEGDLPGALVVERNVLEWRLDPTGEHHLPEVRDFAQPVVIVCSEGYASSLAAAALTELGYEHAFDLDGGYTAWAEMSRQPEENV